MIRWDDLVKIAVDVIAYIGGGSVVIIGITKVAINIIADKIERKYENKLQKELADYKVELDKELEQYKSSLSKKIESYKSKLENKTYVSRTRFDTEFDIYRNLSTSFFEMVKKITNLIPVGMVHKLADKEMERERENQMYKLSAEATQVAQDFLMANEAFIPENLFSQYYDILKKCQMQLSAFERRWDQSYIASQEEKERFSVEEYKLSATIRDDLKCLNGQIRAYLNQLDVIE